MNRSYWPVGFKYCYIFFIAVVIVSIALLSACGKKAPPIPPAYSAPPVIEGLEIVMDKNSATLQWPNPARDGTDGNTPAGFYVYRSRMPLNGTKCEGCPLRFKRVADIHLTRRYTEILDNGYRYSFKVSAYTDSGDEGEMSDAVTVDCR